MRPLRLIMNAFGPYAGEQVIDFCELNGRNIFLITGPTGAGKTTIFDAICYAVFGKGSGRDRDGENMRSDFAADDAPTYVELEFELNGRRYYIKRKPRQFKKKARGDGYTEQVAEAEFKDLSGDSPETVAGIREVNEKVQQILGISYEQFKQIIMIPQGEFRELLTSDSKDREGILQRIFGTEGFRKVQDRLVEQEKSLREEVKLLFAQRDAYIRRLDCGSNEALVELTETENINIAAVTAEVQRFIAYEETVQAELEQAEKEQDFLASQKQKAIFQAQEINRKFNAKEEAWKNKELLESKAGEYLDMEKRLQLARKTFSLRVLEDSLADKRNFAQKKQETLAGIVRQLTDLREKTAEAKSRYQTELSKEADRIQFQEQLTVLKGYAEKVDELDLARARQREAERALREIEAELSKAKDRIEIIKAEIKENHANLADARSAAAEYAERAAELEAATRKSERLVKLQTENDKLETLRRTFEVKQVGLKREKEILDNRQHEYNEIRERFLRGQAGLLAKGLIDGEACPVCGSRHHPLPAVLTADIPTEEQFKTLEADLKKAAEQYEKIRDEFEKTKAEGLAQRRLVEDLKQEVAERLGENIESLEKDALSQFIKEKAWSLANMCLKLSEQVKELESRKQREEALSQSLGEREKQLLIAEEQFHKVNNQYVAAFADERSAKSAVNRLLAEIPDHVQGRDMLAVEIGRVQDMLLAAKEAFKQAEEDYRKATLEYEKKLTERQAGELAVNEAVKDLADAEAKFNNGLTSAGFFNLHEYQAAKMTEKDAAELEREISGYREKLSSAREAYQVALAAVDGLTLIDISRLEEELAAIQAAKANITRRKTELFARIKNNRDILALIETANSALDNKEREYGIIAELANTAKGNNEEKLSFERYVLAAFFEDIIGAANIRLTKMTGGRYAMSRIAARGKGTAQSGLEIEVFDNYTGRSRHIKTLSGGESFKASLALALGLADVVQAYAGGISLDTMFIDEGFGTLDPESLDNAIHCLVELQYSGRLVGIISHVPELKASIDARLEIEAGKDGSKAHFCIA